jgi:hypothetical protein
MTVDGEELERWREEWQQSMARKRMKWRDGPSNEMTKWA